SPPWRPRCGPTRAGSSPRSASPVPCTGSPRSGCRRWENGRQRRRPTCPGAWATASDAPGPAEPTRVLGPVTGRRGSRPCPGSAAGRDRPGRRRPVAPVPVRRVPVPARRSALRCAPVAVLVSAPAPAPARALLLVRELLTGPVRLPVTGGCRGGALELAGGRDLAVRGLLVGVLLGQAGPQVFLHADVLEAGPQVGVVAQADDQRELGERRGVEQAGGVEELHAQRVRDGPLEFQQVGRVGTADGVVE